MPARPQSIRRAIRHRLPLQSEAGQSLVILVLAMFVITAMAATAIDLSSWYQKHHQAQVAADAAALAAANCEAAGTCNDTSATQTAVNYAKTNSGVTIPNSDVSIANKTVTVTTPLPAPSFFAAAVSSAFGNVTATAKASATWDTHGSNCSPSAPRCAFIFANDDSCSGVGASVTTMGTAGVLTGTVISNSNITWGASGNPGGTAYATENVDCGGASGSSWASKNTYPVSSYWPNDWPINYANVYPACGPGMAYACGPSGTPSYCTDSGASFTSSTSFNGNQFYCAYGTGTLANPATWNGTITVPSGFAGSKASFIGGTINIPSTLVLSPYTSADLLAYATSTANSSSCSTNSTNDALNVNGSGQTGTITGDVFVPNGTACFDLGGNETYSGFIQADDVYYTSHGNDTGDGPLTSSSGGDPMPPTDSLTS